jgi:hypothetical protein
MGAGRTLLGSLVATVAVTAALGWWGVPLLAAGWAVVRPEAPRPTLAAGAALAWAGLLGWRALTGPVSLLADRLAGILGAPAWVLLAAVPLASGLAAWSAATVGARLRR